MCVFDMPSLASCIKSISPTFLKEKRLTEERIVEKDEAEHDSDEGKSVVVAPDAGGSKSDPDHDAAVVVEGPSEAVVPEVVGPPVLWSEEVDAVDDKPVTVDAKPVTVDAKPVTVPDPADADCVLQDIPSPVLLMRTGSYVPDEEQLHDMPPSEKFPNPDGWHPPLQPHTSRVHSWVSTLTRLTNVESSVNEMRFAQVDLEGLVDRFGSVLASLEEKVQRLDDGRHGRPPNPRFGGRGGGWNEKAFGRPGDPILGAPFSIWGETQFVGEESPHQEAGRGYPDSGWTQSNRGRGQGFRRGRRGRGGG